MCRHQRGTRHCIHVVHICFLNSFLQNKVCERFGERPRIHELERIQKSHSDASLMINSQVHSRLVVFGSTAAAHKRKLSHRQKRHATQRARGSNPKRRTWRKRRSKNSDCGQVVTAPRWHESEVNLATKSSRHKLLAASVRCRLRTVDEQLGQTSAERSGIVLSD